MLLKSYSRGRDLQVDECSSSPSLETRKFIESDLEKKRVHGISEKRWFMIVQHDSWGRPSPEYRTEWPSSRTLLSFFRVSSSSSSDRAWKIKHDTLLYWQSFLIDLSCLLLSRITVDSSLSLFLRRNDDVIPHLNNIRENTSLGCHYK
jgi:hypothetical protein